MKKVVARCIHLDCFLKTEKRYSCKTYLSQVHNTPSARFELKVIRPRPLDKEHAVFMFIGLADGLLKKH